MDAPNLGAGNESSPGAPPRADAPPPRGRGPQLQSGAQRIKVTNAIRRRLLAQGQTHYGDKPDKHPVSEASCTLCTPAAMPSANHADEHSTSIELPGVHLNPSIDEIKGAPTDGIDPEEPPTLELPPVIQIPDQWKIHPATRSGQLLPPLNRS